MTDKPYLEAQILNELRSAENRTKILRPKDFNITSDTLGMMLDVMEKRGKICKPSGIVGTFRLNLLGIDPEVEVTMYPGID